MNRRYCQDYTETKEKVEKMELEAWRNSWLYQAYLAAPMLGFLIALYLILWFTEPGFRFFLGDLFRIAVGS